MADRVELHVRIGADGSVEAETVNVTGAACLDFVAILEDLLDATTVESSYTADYDRAAAEVDLENPNELRQY